MSDADISNLPDFRYDPFRSDTLIALDDPFIGSLQQTTRMRCYCKIMVGGKDVTDKMDPHLISVRVVIGTPSDALEIELDDRDALLPLPNLGSAVVVALGWESENIVTVFNGWIDDVEHGFGRKQGGRRLWVHANSSPFHLESLRSPIQDHLGEGAPPGKKEGQLHGLPDWIQQLTKHVGIPAQINNTFDKFKNDYWDIANSSVYHQLSTLGEKFGFWHRFAGPDGLLIEKVGQGGLSCHATWRDNLISWRVRPFVMRQAVAGSKAEWFDPQSSHWKGVEQMFGLKGLFGSAVGKGQQSTPAATESGAGQQNEAAQQGADATKYSSGRIIINGEARAKANSYVLLTGARPGVDGLYLIDGIEHVYSRQGFITTLDVMADARAPDNQSVSRGWPVLPKSAFGTGSGSGAAPPPELNPASVAEGETDPVDPAAR